MRIRIRAISFSTSPHLIPAGQCQDLREGVRQPAVGGVPPQHPRQSESRGHAPGSCRHPQHDSGTYQYSRTLTYSSVSISVAESRPEPVCGPAPAPTPA